MSKFEQSIGDENTVVGFRARVELSAGTMLGRYRIIKLLGRGGMGQVYLVQHELQKTTHALKILPSEFSGRSGFVERFRTELQTMARLQHENIVHVTHSDEQDGLYYLVMDFIAADGTDEPYDLEEALAEQNQFDPETVRALMLQICNGLAYAHSHGVVHRDLKPANILLTQKIAEVGGQKSVPITNNEYPITNNLICKITDFGLAKVAGEEQLRTMVAQSIQRSMSLGDESTFVEKKRSERSSTGSVLGTYGYMSPEQEEGRPADERSDLYALGVMMYRMITGQRLRGMAKSPSKIVPGLDPAWDGIIETCLEPNPEERFQSVEELKAALAGGGSQRSEVRSQKSPQKGAKSARKAVAGLLVAGVVVGVYFGVQGLAQRKSITENDAHEMKVRIEDAVTALEQDIVNRGQGFGEKLDELRRKLRLAQAAHSSQSWKQAYTAFNEVEKECDQLRVLNVSRNDAAVQRAQMESRQKAAKSAKADSLSKKEWEQAVGAALVAAQSFEKGNFEEASRDWKNAAEMFQSSEEIAVAVSEYWKAKQEWESLTAKDAKETRKAMQQHASVEWMAAEKAARLGAECENEPLRGKEHYETALAKYAEAVAKTEPFLVPRLAVNATPSGADVSIVGEGGERVPGSATPAVELEKGKRYTLTVSRQGYKKHEETLTADWTGARDHPVKLEKWISPEEGQPWTSKASGMEFVWIRQMGMWVGKYEVTNGEYRRKEPGHDSKSYEGHSMNHDRQPVVYVNFDDAQAYARWLTERDRASGNLPPGFEYRLPTGDEWMRFAQCDDKREYPWGNEWPPPSGRAGNYSGQESAWSYKISEYRDDFPVTCKVEQSWANPWGLYGVGGNVWECTTVTPNGAFDAWRGASWVNGIQGCLRCSARHDINASFRYLSLGFRLVLSRPGQK